MKESLTRKACRVNLDTGHSTPRNLYVQETLSIAKMFNVINIGKLLSTYIVMGNAK